MVDYPLLPDTDKDISCFFKKVTNGRRREEKRILKPANELSPLFAFLCCFFEITILINNDLSKK